MESLDEEHPTVWNSIEMLVGFAHLAVIGVAFAVMVVVAVGVLFSAIF